jgi:tetratricopeptide (TPR) repeat protein
MALFKLFTSFCCAFIIIVSVSFSQAQTLEMRQEEAQKVYFKGLEEYRKDNLDAAIDFFSQALKLNPNYAQAFNNRGLVYSRKRAFDSAVSDFSSALAIGKPSVGYLLNRSNAYYGKGDYIKALEDTDQAFEIEPNSFYVWNTRGLIHRRMKEFQKAIDDYTNAIKVNPISAAYGGRCLTYYDLGKYEEAAADCSESILLKPNTAMSYYYRGLARVKFEQNALAISDFRKAIEINPNFREAQNELDKLLKINK